MTLCDWQSLLWGPTYLEARNSRYRLKIWDASLYKVIFIRMIAYLPRNTVIFGSLPVGLFPLFWALDIRWLGAKYAPSLLGGLKDYLAQLLPLQVFRVSRKLQYLYNPSLHLKLLSLMYSYLVFTTIPTLFSPSIPHLPGKHKLQAGFMLVSMCLCACTSKLWNIEVNKNIPSLLPKRKPMAWF